PVTAGAPAEHAHLRAIDNSLGDQVVDARHDVFVALLEITADDVGFVLFAVVGRPPVVGHQYRVARTGVSLRAVAAIEAEHIGGCRSAVDGDDQWIAMPLLISDWLDQNSTDGLPVGGLPIDLFFVAKREVADLWIGVGKLAP